jgi:bacteriorhodopsin
MLKVGQLVSTLRVEVMLVRVVDRYLAALGRHVTYRWVYWACVLVVVAIAVVASLATGLWGTAGLVLATFSMLALLAKPRHERSLDG